MIYISTYLRLLTLDEDKKKLYAEVFDVKVEDLKRISPSRWNQKMRGSKGDGIKQRLLLVQYKSVEETTKKYKEGKITGKHLEQINLTYSEWQSQIDMGIFSVIGYPGDNRKNNTNFIKLQKVYDKKNLTKKYDKYFDKSGSKTMTELEIYEYQNTIYIFQNVFELDLVDMEHVFAKGIYDDVEGSLLFKDGLSCNGEMWGSREWVIEQVKNQGYKIEETELYEKEFNSTLLVHFAQRGYSYLLCSGIYLKLGPIDFTLGRYDKVFELDKSINDNEAGNIGTYRKSIYFNEQKASGSLQDDYKKKFQYNYELWCKKGRHDIIDFFNIVLPLGMVPAYECAKALLDVNYTEGYTSIFNRDLGANTAPLAIYEDPQKGNLDCLQRIFVEDYYSIDHMIELGCWNENEWKYLNSAPLAVNGVKFGTKEWIKECCKLNNVDTEVFKGKTINMYIYLVFGQSGFSSLISPKQIPIMKDIRF